MDIDIKKESEKVKGNNKHVESEKVYGLIAMRKKRIYKIHYTTWVRQEEEPVLYEGWDVSDVYEGFIRDKGKELQGSGNYIQTGTFEDVTEKPNDN